jgi:hypothetical protein
MKTRTTLFLLLITLGAGAWLLLKESGATHNAGGHLLFDWSDTAQQQEKEKLKVDVIAAEVTGIDLKSSTAEISLRREADGSWSLTKGVQDRADGALVKTLLDYLSTATISDVIERDELNDGTVSESSLGLDDAGAWRVSWLGAEGKVLSEMRAGKSAPLGGAGYVQLKGQKQRPDIYIVKPDLRPELARPLDSFRDSRACRYREEQVHKVVVRKGEGEVELGRTMIPGAEPGDWLITRPLANAPADQKIAKEFVATICGLKVKGWMPYMESTDKPLVEVTVFPPVTGAKGTTLSFFPDPSAPEATAICRDAQRKATFKVDKETVDYFCLADSPNPFRSRKLPVMVEPAVISTVEVRTPQDSVVLARVGDRWSWRPLAGGEWSEAAVERLEKLITAVTESDILDFASDSLADPKEFALDQPDYIVTFAAGAHLGLENLTPMNKDNSRSLRIAIRQDGQIFANYAGDPFVYRVGPELSSAIPLTFNKWRSLALPGFSINQIRSLKRTIGTTPPLEMKYNTLTQRWTIIQAGAEVTPMYATASIESLAGKLGTLSVANWLDSPDEANKALQNPAVIIEVQHDQYGERAADTKLTTTTLTLAPLPSSPNAPLCYGKHSGEAGPFLIKIDTLRDMTADLLIRK